MKKINKTKALDMIKATRGRFFGVTFTKKDGTDRTMNAQYAKQNDSKLGYVVLRDRNAKSKSKFRNVNLQTIKSLTIKETYLVK